jgi:phosphonopyruvate decarboxylase
MIAAEDFATHLMTAGVEHVTGVPCSYLGSLVGELSARSRYTAAAHEGSAVGMAVGRWLGGQPTAVLLQNSGLGNLVNPLTSLVQAYRIPLPMIVSLRGFSGQDDHEEHHGPTGRSTLPLLEALGVDIHMLDGTLEDLTGTALPRLVDAIATRRPFALLVAAGTFAPLAPASVPESAMTSLAVVRAVARAAADALVIASTGMLSRELCAEDDAPTRFYMQGSMGHSIAIGHGLSDVQSRAVVVLDGDGAVLMHLGASAVLARSGPRRLVHVVVDNGTYSSTGGQPTPTAGWDIAAVARALGYRRAWTCRTPEQVQAHVVDGLAAGWPVLVHALVTDGLREAPRIGRHLTNPEVCERFTAAASATP